MEFQIGDIVKLKKAHPCGINEWEILRVGMDSVSYTHLTLPTTSRV